MARIAVVDDRVTNRNILTRLAASVEEGLVGRRLCRPVEALAGIRRRPAARSDHHRLQHAGDGRRQLRAGAAQPAGAGRRADHRHHRLPGSRVLLSRARGRSHRLPAQPGRSSRVPGACPQPADAAPPAAAAGRARGRPRARAAHEARRRRSRTRCSGCSTPCRPPSRWSTRTGGWCSSTAPTSSCSGSTAATALGRPVHGEPQRGVRAAERGAATRRCWRPGSRSASPFYDTLSGPGGTRWLLTTKAPLSDGSGRATEVLTVALDVTELRAAEATTAAPPQEDPLTGLPSARATSGRGSSTSWRVPGSSTRCWRCSISTSTASRASTTRSARSSAPSCCARWRCA